MEFVRSVAAWVWKAIRVALAVGAAMAWFVGAVVVGLVMGLLVYLRTDTKLTDPGFWLVPLIVAVLVMVALACGVYFLINWIARPPKA